MGNIGDKQDDHGEGVETSLIGAVEPHPREELLKGDDDRMQGRDLSNPSIDSRG